MPQARTPPSAAKPFVTKTQLVPQIVPRPDLPRPEDVAKGPVPVVTRQATYGLPLKTTTFPKVMAPAGWIVPTLTLEGQVGVSRGASTKTVKADTGDGAHKVGAEVAAGDLKVGLSLDPKAFAEGLKSKKPGLGLTPSVEVSGQPVGSVQPSFGIEGNTVFAKYDFKAKDLVWKGTTINGQFSLKFSLAFEPDPKLAAAQAIALVGIAIAISGGSLTIPVGAAFGLMAAAS